MFFQPAKSNFLRFFFIVGQISLFFKCYKQALTQMHPAVMRKANFRFGRANKNFFLMINFVCDERLFFGNAEDERPFFKNAAIDKETLLFNAIFSLFCSSQKRFGQFSICQKFERSLFCALITL